MLNNFMDKEQIYYKIKHLPFYLIGKYKKSGLMLVKKDERDFKIGSIWGSLLGTEYTPKEKRLLLNTLSIKDQENLNTCVYNGTCVCKEPDEGVLLSVKSMVRYARRKGYLNGNGWSDIKAGQRVLQEFGAMEEIDMPDTGKGDWESYSTGDLDFSKAEKHKIKSYWSLTNRNQILKALDEGRLINSGMLWYSGFNQSGGFKSPWLITKSLGYSVGGHDLAIIGYDLDYFGNKVYIIQNSYSKYWGDNGKFYVSMDYMDKQMFNGYDPTINLDLDSDVGSFIIKYDGKDVKGKNSPAIYHIQNGVKKVYLHEMDYFVWNSEKDKLTFELVDDDILKKIPDGDKMDITKSVYWPILKHLEKPLNLTRVIQAIKENKQ